MDSLMDYNIVYSFDLFVYVIIKINFDIRAKIALVFLFQNYLGSSCQFQFYMDFGNSKLDSIK